jgi:hypothetical protein
VNRDVLVAALGKVEPPLAVSPTAPSTIVAGCAWPVWASTSWRNQCATDESWYVFAALTNGDQGATVSDGDATLDDVAAVLWPVGKVETVEPWAWPVEAGQQAVPVLRFTVSMTGG